MSGAQLEVRLEPHPDGFGPSGQEQVEFRVATNPGLPVSPLREAASGGELSRVMLALAGQGARGGAGTFVFDEIDAGVGGSTARAVGERLRALGEERQVLCITHLPQVASLAEISLPDREADRGRPGDGRGPARGRRRAGRRDRPHAGRRPGRRDREQARARPARRRPRGRRLPARRRSRAGRRETIHNAGDGDHPPPPLRARFSDDSQRPPAERGPVHGTARLGKRTKDLVKRLGSTDVAVIDHRNLDRIAAEELITSGVRAVVNVSPSSDGSYPNAGPLTLVRAGVPLIDVQDPALFERLRDGDPLVLDGGSVRIAGEVVAEGRLLEADELARELDEQRRRIDRALHDFTENTMAHIREEGALLSGTIDFPETRTVFRDRHALIVVRGTDHMKDLRALRAYIHDVRPVLVGVDGGGDAIVKEGLAPTSCSATWTRPARKRCGPAPS